MITKPSAKLSAGTVLENCFALEVPEASLLSFAEAWTHDKISETTHVSSLLSTSDLEKGTTVGISDCWDRTFTGAATCSRLCNPDAVLVSPSPGDLSLLSSSVKDRAHL